MGSLCITSKACIIYFIIQYINLKRHDRYNILGDQNFICYKQMVNISYGFIINSSLNLYSVIIQPYCIIFIFLLSNSDHLIIHAFRSNRIDMRKRNALKRLGRQINNNTNIIYTRAQPHNMYVLYAIEIKSLGDNDRPSHLNYIKLNKNNINRCQLLFHVLYYNRIYVIYTLHCPSNKFKTYLQQ